MGTCCFNSRTKENENKKSNLINYDSNQLDTNQREEQLLKE